MLSGYMNNPFGNPFFQTQQQLGTRQAQNLGGTQMSNILRNLSASGLGGGSSSPFAMEMLQNQGRANTGLQAQLGFLNPVQNALGMQQFAGGLASQYRPLQTGQNTTQSTGGLGTWLPQVAGMGLSALTGLPFGGGGGGSSPWSLTSPGASGFDYGSAYNSPTGFSGAGAPNIGSSWVPGMGSSTPSVGGFGGLGTPPPPPGGPQ